MENIKLAIVGSRDFNNYSVLEYVIDKIIETNDYKITEIISGGARGADALGEIYADKHAIDKTIFPADWKTYGKRAGFLRNVDIIKNCDICVCFWNGESHGTKHDIDLCKQYNKTCFIYYYKTDQLEIQEN